MRGDLSGLGSLRGGATTCDAVIQLANERDRAASTSAEGNAVDSVGRHTNAGGHFPG